MNKEKLFTINFIVQAVITAVSQIINIVQQTKTKTKTKTKDESEQTDSEG